MKKPIIGIVSKNMTKRQYYNWQWQIVSDRIRYALIKNGAMVIAILPQKQSQEFNDADEHEEVEFDREEAKKLVETLKLCDGIILQGGITSHYYEEYIARYCYYNNIPCIGICAGFNNIIRGLGGSTELTTETSKHDRPDLTYSHDCLVIDKNSKYYKIVGSEKFEVNSVHTYIAKSVPKQLCIVARSDDGQVEVVEAKDKKFFMGIKHHPELLVDIDEKQNKIFEEFVKSCSKS